MSEAWLALLTGAAMAIGVLGTLIPIVPGVGLVWIAALAWGALTGFDAVAAVAMALITALAAFGLYLGVRIPQKTASAEGLSTSGLVVGVVGALVLAFALPVLGAPIGFVLGVWIVRLRATGDPGSALQSSIRTTVALVRASAAQFAVAIGMALVWVAWLVIG